MQLDAATPTLAAREPGEEIVIRRIIAGGLRSYYAELDLLEGDHVRIEGAGHSFLRIRTARERIVLIDRDVARVVEVAPVAEQGSKPPEDDVRQASRPRRNGPCWCRSVPLAPAKPR